MGQRLRMTMEFDKATYDRMESLVDATGAASKAEVLRKALQLYEIMTDPDSKTFIRNEDGSETRLLVV